MQFQLFEKLTSANEFQVEPETSALSIQIGSFIGIVLVTIAWANLKKKKKKTPNNVGGE